MTIVALDEQSSSSGFMQLKVAKLIENIRKAGSNSQALYTLLAGMADELAGARYAGFINKRFSELRAERFEKILEESRDLGAGWNLQELKDKLINTGKKEIASIRRRGGQVLQREQRVDRNLRGGAPVRRYIYRRVKVLSR